MIYILGEKDGKKFSSSFKEVEKTHVEDVFRKTALEILQVLDRPRTLKEISKSVNISPQAAFYHLKRMIKGGVVKHTSEGKYVRTHDAYGVILDRKPVRNNIPSHIIRFFNEFVERGVWTSNIVVGAPDPHGYFLRRARDGHYSTMLGYLIGRYFEVSGFFVKVDSDMITSWRENNLILLGGPISNMVTYELLEEKKVFFDVSSPLIIEARKQYGSEYAGVIAKLKHNGKWYILVAGVSSVGTKSAVYALSLNTEEILSSYRGGEYYWIVEGYDVNGDGHIDVVKVLEKGRPEF